MSSNGDKSKLMSDLSKVGNELFVAFCPWAPPCDYAVYVMPWEHHADVLLDAAPTHALGSSPVARCSAPVASASAAGETLNCNTYDTATAIAQAIHADKLVCMHDGPVDNGWISLNAALRRANAMDG